MYGVVVMKTENIAARAGIEPTSLALWASALTMTTQALWCHNCIDAYLSMW